MERSSGGPCPKAGGPGERIPPGQGRDGRVYRRRAVASGTLTQDFVAQGGDLLACGTSLKLRQQGSTDLCPASTLADLYALVRDCDTVLTF